MVFRRGVVAFFRVHFCDYSLHLKRKKLVTTTIYTLMRHFHGNELVFKTLHIGYSTLIFPSNLRLILTYISALIHPRSKGCNHGNGRSIL